MDRVELKDILRIKVFNLFFKIYVCYCIVGVLVHIRKKKS